MFFWPIEKQTFFNMKTHCTMGKTDQSIYFKMRHGTPLMTNFWLKLAYLIGKACKTKPVSVFVSRFSYFKNGCNIPTRASIRINHMYCEMSRVIGSYQHKLVNNWEVSFRECKIKAGDPCLDTIWMDLLGLLLDLHHSLNYAF